MILKIYFFKIIKIKYKIEKKRQDTILVKPGAETYGGMVSTSRKNGRNLSSVIGDLLDESMLNVSKNNGLCHVKVNRNPFTDKMDSFMYYDNIQDGFKGIDEEDDKNPLNSTYCNKERHEDDEQWSEHGKGFTDSIRCCCDKMIFGTKFKTKEGSYKCWEVKYDHIKMSRENNYNPESREISEEEYKKSQI